MERPKPSLKTVEFKRWIVTIPEGTQGQEIQEFFYKTVGWGIVTTKEWKIEFKNPQEEEMYG